jgi:hypothetical protein
MRCFLSRFRAATHHLKTTAHDFVSAVNEIVDDYIQMVA